MPNSLQWWNALEAIGLFMIVGVGLWMAVSHAWWRRSDVGELPEKDLKPLPVGSVEKYPEDLTEAHGGMPLALKLFIFFWVIWTVGYVAIYFVA